METRLTIVKSHLGLLIILLILVFSVFEWMIDSPGRTFAQPAGAGEPAETMTTASPIKHVIVIIGENRTFDHVFATYQPKHGQTVSNLLSKGIVNEDGSPGPNYSLSAQYNAVDNGTFSIHPQGKSLYTNIPPVMTDGAPTKAPFAHVAVAKAAEPNLALGYTQYLTTGGTGLARDVVDARFPNPYALGGGVFPITPSIQYDDYASSPVHRFYQMWQQLDCDSVFATPRNPSGCLNDLFPWVEVTIGAGSNGRPQPAGFNDLSTGEGSSAMGFYNVAKGDAPYLKSLADRYAMSDNFHQAAEGGTGVNHIMLFYGDDIWYSNGGGETGTPPANQIENPDPQAGTNNYYTQDGYSGGTYSECSDTTQPGVASVVAYLASLARPINPNCEAGHYYILNNYNPGYLGDGTPAPLGPNRFTIPPTSVRHIGDELLERNISFKYYGEGWDRYVAGLPSAYCKICNGFQYSTSMMTNPALRAAYIQDEPHLFDDIAAHQLPAVSFLKPSGFADGHPATSKLDLFEGFVKKVVEAVKSDKELWGNTAILVTFDEGGGYYDSGYVQPLDFFGDGTRIPLLAVSSHALPGRVIHTYGDHVSILKFIERNWELDPLTGRSRDNLPNPVTSAADPYVPLNSPAIGDLFDLFDF
ncbi:MAG TPA: alkaline phosphatase family protein [Nitrospiria bacterium]|nr:alkaline phosphatase family protein [Nitrospiria bacterium]